LPPCFYNLHPSSPYLQSFFAFIVVHSLAFSNLNFFAFFELNSWALLYSQGLFLFTIAQTTPHFQHSFPLWNCRWWLFVYCCIFNGILIIFQFFLFDSYVVLFSKFLLIYKYQCVCLFVHVFLSMMKL
jgi:hypothetical protein